jgi:tetratricopeptide (TPR) repeat protein
VEEVYGHLAHHYSSAEIADRAIEYLTRLAEKAARAHAHTEAMRALDEALTHVDRLPATARDRQRVELVLRQVGSLIALGRFREILDRLIPEGPHVARLDDHALTGRYHFLLGHTCSFVGDHDRAIQHARLAVEAARRAGDRVTLGRASCALALEAFWSGQPLEGIGHGREAVLLLAPLDERLWLGLAHWAVGINHAQLGDFADAVAEQARAEAIAEAIADPRLGTLTAWGTGVVYAAAGDHERGIEACRRAVARAPDPLHIAIATGWLGYAHLEKGEPATALPYLEQSVTQLGRFRFGQFQAWLTVFLAEAHRLAGRLERARELAGQALAMVSEHGFPYAVGWAERSLGRIALAEGVLSEAEARFGAALSAFGRVQARYDVARTTLELAALARARGDAGAAARHLAEARRAFRELGAAEQLARADRLAAELGLSDAPTG